MNTRQKINYISTRGEKRNLTSAQAIIQGIASDGGLYVPDNIPKLNMEIEDLLEKNYREIALLVLSKFLTDFTVDELKHCVDKAYDSKFEADEIVPLKKGGDGYFLELYHGKTSAFKDMALSILPYLLTTAIKKEKEDKKIVILTATSGDTGKAALEGFANVEGTEIIVFFPKNGVSKIQALQMTTQEGNNVHVYSIDGNFDDAQTGVKNIFNDKEFAKDLEKEGYKLSSANSINIGRLVPQVAYYLWAYLELLRKGELKKGQQFNVSVPTGNFGNILAAYYAKEMGVPIGKFICASNMNNVLTDFFAKKEYDSQRKFHITSSPSMDILISSNLERLLYHLSNGDTGLIDDLMKKLSSQGKYQVAEPISSGMEEFFGGFADEEKTQLAIKKMYGENGYLMDTHTAVGYQVYQQYKETSGDQKPVVIASTASPYKFPESVNSAIGLEGGRAGFEALDALYEKTQLAIPKELKALRKKPVLHKETLDKSQMKKAVEKSLK